MTDDALEQWIARGGAAAEPDSSEATAFVERVMRRRHTLARRRMAAFGGAGLTGALAAVTTIGVRPDWFQPVQASDVASALVLVAMCGVAWMAAEARPAGSSHRGEK
jgi:hypothetical protein